MLRAANNGWGGGRGGLLGNGNKGRDRGEGALLRGNKGGSRGSNR